MGPPAPRRCLPLPPAGQTVPCADGTNPFKRNLECTRFACWHPEHTVRLFGGRITDNEWDTCCCSLLATVSANPLGGFHKENSNHNQPQTEHKTNMLLAIPYIHMAATRDLVFILKQLDRAVRVGAQHTIQILTIMKCDPYRPERLANANVSVPPCYSINVLLPAFGRNINSISDRHSGPQWAIGTHTRYNIYSLCYFVALRSEKDSVVPEVISPSRRKTPKVHISTQRQENTLSLSLDLCVSHDGNKCLCRIRIEPKATMR